MRPGAAVALALLALLLGPRPGTQALASPRAPAAPTPSPTQWRELSSQLKAAERALLDALRDYRDELSPVQSKEEKWSRKERKKQRVDLEKKQRRKKGKPRVPWMKKKKKKKKTTKSKNEGANPTYKITIGESSENILGNKVSTASQHLVRNPYDDELRDAGRKAAADTPSLREVPLRPASGQHDRQKKKKKKKNVKETNGKLAEDIVRLIAGQLKGEFASLRAAVQSRDSRAGDGGDAREAEEHEEADSDRRTKGNRNPDTAEARLVESVLEDDPNEQRAGSNRSMEESTRHFGLRKLSEKGATGAKFDVEGRHEKGHSTRGKHNVHKKDVFHKQHEFYDEDHEDDRLVRDSADAHRLRGVVGSHDKKEAREKARGHDSARHQGGTIQGAFGRAGRGQTAGDMAGTDAQETRVSIYL